MNTTTVSTNIYFKKPFDIDDENLFNIRFDELRRLKFSTTDLNVTIKSNSFKNDIENLVNYNVIFNKWFLYSEKKNIDVCSKIIFQYEMIPYFKPEYSKNITYLECMFRSFNTDTTNNYTSSGYFKDIVENKSENKITQYSYLDELGELYYITHDENKMFLRITKCINLKNSPCLTTCYKILIDKLFHIVKFINYIDFMSADGIFPIINDDNLYLENNILNSKAFYVFEVQFNSYLNCDSLNRIDENSNSNNKIALKCFERDLISFSDKFIFAKTDWIGDKVLVLYDCKNKIILFRNNKNEINISHIDLYFKNSMVFTATLFDRNQNNVHIDYNMNNIYNCANIKKVIGRDERVEYSSDDENVNEHDGKDDDDDNIICDEEIIMVIDDVLSVYENGIFWEINKSSSYLFYDLYNILKLSHCEQFSDTIHDQNDYRNKIKHFKNIKYQHLTSVYYNLPKKFGYVEYVSLLKFLISLINKCILEKHKVDDYIRNYMFNYVFSNEFHDIDNVKTSFINGLVFIKAPSEINKNINCRNNYVCNKNLYYIKSPLHRELSINRVLYDLFQKYSTNENRCFKFYDNYFLSKQHVYINYFNYKFTNIDLTLLINRNNAMLRENIIGLPDCKKLLPCKVYKFCTHNFSAATHYFGTAFNFNLAKINFPK